MVRGSWCRPGQSMNRERSNAHNHHLSLNNNPHARPRNRANDFVRSRSWPITRAQTNLSVPRWRAVAPTSLVTTTASFFSSSSPFCTRTRESSNRMNNDCIDLAMMMMVFLNRKIENVECNLEVIKEQDFCW